MFVCFLNLSIFNPEVTFKKGIACFSCQREIYGNTFFMNW